MFIHIYVHTYFIINYELLSELGQQFFPFPILSWAGKNGWLFAWGCKMFLGW